MAPRNGRVFLLSYVPLGISTQYLGVVSLWFGSSWRGLLPAQIHGPDLFITSGSLEHAHSKSWARLWEMRPL